MFRKNIKRILICEFLDAIVRNIQIQTSPSNSDQLTVTWLAHPKETLCTLRYKYTYSIDGEIESTSELEETEVTFDKAYCANGELSIVAFNDDGISTEPAIEDLPAESKRINEVVTQYFKIYLIRSYQY